MRKGIGSIKTQNFDTDNANLLSVYVTISVFRLSNRRIYINFNRLALTNWQTSYFH